MPTICVDTWDDLHDCLQKDVRQAWHAAVLRSAQMCANLSEDGIVFQEVLEGILVGTRPSWWPTALPRIHVDWQMASPGSATRTRTLSVDPNRSDLGLRSLLGQTRGALVPNPLPFVGTLSFRVSLAATPLASRTWAVELGTQLPVNDPDVRAALHQSRQLIDLLMRQVAQKDRAMFQMFRESGKVLKASAAVISEIDDPRLKHSMQQRQDESSRALASLLEALRTSLGTPNEPSVEQEEEEESDDEMFDAWKAAGIHVPPR